MFEIKRNLKNTSNCNSLIETAMIKRRRLSSSAIIQVCNIKETKIRVVK